MTEFAELPLPPRYDEGDMDMTDMTVAEYIAAGGTLPANVDLADDEVLTYVPASSGTIRFASAEADE